MKRSIIIISISVSAVALFIFFVVEYLNKDECDLKKYLKNCNFDNISLIDVEYSDNSINIRYNIDNYKNYIKDSLKLKKEVERFLQKNDKTDHDVCISIGWQSLPDGIVFANYNANKDHTEKNIDFSSSNGQLEYGYFCCPEFDLRDFENEHNYKMLLLYGFKDFDNIDILDNMKEIQFAGFRLWNEQDVIPEELINHFKEAHPNCIVEVQ